MTITVRFFAMLREQAGVASVRVEGATTAEEAIADAARRTGLEELVAAIPIAIAVNRNYADKSTPVADGDEIALIPPVSGGSAVRLHARLTSDPLSTDRLIRFVRDPRAGAIVTFQGEPREVDRLDFEAYEEMATSRVNAILSELADQYELIAIAAEHRIGQVPRGQPCVVVAVSAAHRPAAFAAASAAIDRIKQDVPIWKQEIDGDRREWATSEHR